MMSIDELNQIINQNANTESVLLATEVQRLQNYIRDFTVDVQKRVMELESDMIALENENQRMVKIKNMLAVERDACLGLLAQVANRGGMSVGVVPAKTENGPILVAMDLPSGQVSWEIEPTESHLFAGLDEYLKPIEEITIEEKYSRVMNPSLL